MTSLRQKLFKKTSAKKINERVYTLQDFEDTFAFTKKMLNHLAIPSADDVPGIRTACLNLYFVLEMVNILLATPAEFFHMMSTLRASQGFNDILRIFRTMPCFGSCVLSIIKFVKMKYNRGSFEELFSELRGMWPQGEVSEEEHRAISATFQQLHIIIKSFLSTIYQMVYMTRTYLVLQALIFRALLVKARPFACKGYYWCNSILLVSFFITPGSYCIKRYRGLDTRMVLSFDYWLPFDPFKPYILEVMLVLQFWAAMVVLYFNVLWEMMFCTYLAQITMQFNLLAHRIRRLVYVPIDHQLEESFPLADISREFLQNEEDAILSYSDKDWEVRHQRELVEIVKRHHALIRMAGQVEKIYSFVLLVNFLYSSIMICFSGFCCVLLEKWNEITYKTYLMTALAQTWLLCWYGQQLLDSSYGVSRALYESGWYLGSRRIKSAVLIMLQRSQNGIHVTTYGFSIVSLMSFSTIMKTSWSYFTLLLNFYTNISTDIEASND